MKYVPMLCTSIAVFMAGCSLYNNPYQFRIGGPHVSAAEILTSLPSVDHEYNVATLHGPAAVDLNYFGATQYLLNMGVRLKQGEGFRVLLRPVVEQRNVKDSGLVLTATRNGTSIMQGTTTIISRPDVMLTQNQLVHVALLSENNYMQVVLECDTVFRGFTKAKESDDVVIEALDGSEIEVVKPDWAGLPDRE